MGRSRFVIAFALALVAALGLAGRADTAQGAGKVWFEMLEDLEGFEAEFLGEHSTLYDFEPFTARSKSWISAAELEALRAAWARERARVAAEIARLAADPAARSLHRVRQKVDKNAYFSDIDKQWVDRFAPFHYVVQRPQKEDPGYYERKATDYAKWSAALLEVFEEEYAGPLGLQRRADHQVFVTAVLSSEGAYGDYGRRNKAGILPGQRAHYDTNLRVAVTYEPWAAGQTDADERRHALMHELVHAFQHAWSTGGDGLPPHPWFNEGFAEYLSSGTSSEIASLREHPLDGDAKRMIADILKDPAGRELYVLPLADLCEASSYADVLMRVWGRARGRPVSPELALSAFYRQAYLLVYFLEREAGGRYRDAFRAYVKSVFQGKGDRAAFERAFAAHDLEALEEGRLAWIDAAAKGWRPRRVEPATKGAAGVAAAAPPPYDPAALRPDVGDPELGLALCAWRVLDGRPEEAREQLTVIAQELEAADPRRARLARELERVEGWIELQARFFRWLAAEEKSVTFELGEKKLRTKVAGVRDGQLVLGENRDGLDALPLETLDPVLLVREMIKARFETDWTRLYMDVLGGRENWERKLPKDDPAAEALRRDAPEYARLLAEGERVERLLALAEAPLPEDGAAAEALLAEIGALLAEGEKSAVVRGAREALRPLAHFCAARAAEGYAQDELFAGRLEELEDGRVRISYPLRDEAELADFERIDALEGLADSGAQLADARFEVGGGTLSVTGRGGLRHIARFEGPQSLSYTLCHPQWGEPASFVAGLCEDGAGSWLIGMGLSGVGVRDLATGDQKQVGSPATIVLGEKYAMQLTLDAEGSFEVRRDGESQGRLASGARRAGAVVLDFESAPAIELSGLVIEGKLAEDSLAVARAALARRRVQELGL